MGNVSVNTGGTFVIFNLKGGALTNPFSNGVAGTGPSNLGTVVVNSANDFNFLGALTDGAAGQLALVQSGSGTTTLQSSGSTYSGGTTVNGGILQVDNLNNSGTGTGPVMVNGGTLTGTGTLGGNVTLAGGSLVPGSIAFAGTITMGGLTLSSGTTDIRLATPTSTSDDLVDVTHNLTLGGTLNVELVRVYHRHLHALPLRCNGHWQLQLDHGIDRLQCVHRDDHARRSAVGRVQHGSSAILGSGSGAANDNIVSGGSGNWNTTGTNWTNSTGSTNSTWQSGTAVFSTPGGTVTLTSPISAQVLIFNNNASYTLAGTQTLTMTSAPRRPSSRPIPETPWPSRRADCGNSGLSIGGQGTVLLTSTGNTYPAPPRSTVRPWKSVTSPSAGSTSAPAPSSSKTAARFWLKNLTSTSLANNISSGLTSAAAPCGPRP